MHVYQLLSHLNAHLKLIHVVYESFQINFLNISVEKLNNELKSKKAN